MMNVIPRWLRNSHLQTLGAVAPLFAPPKSHGAKHEDLRIPIGTEGHKLHARAWWSEAASPRLAVIVVHGIGGSAESHYVVRAGVALHRAGHHVVRLDLRGAGASIPDTPTLYHAGLTQDLETVIGFLTHDPRVSGVAILGFSGGGSVALKLAGEWGATYPEKVRGVVSVSAPLDYTKVGPWMDGLGRLPYRFHVLRGLTLVARTYALTHPSRAHYKPSDVKRMGTFREYDSTVVVPMHGFSNVDDYYERACSGPGLKDIRVPTLLVHAEDDPMVPDHTVRPWLRHASSAVDVVLTPHGGHIGWVAGFDEASWIMGYATKRALSFLDGLS